MLDVLVKRRKREADLFKSDSIQPSTTPVVPPTPTTTESTTTTKPTTNDNTNSDETDSYIQRTYEKEYGPLDANITKYKQKLYPHLYGNKGIMLTREKLKGERNLIQELEKLKAKRNTQIKNATKNLTPFTLQGKKLLILNDLFALDPDDMRSKMFKNIDADESLDASHAWRSPGKLAITTNLIIPGMSGFRIAEIFWVDRIPEYYKTFGAFQLFGLTEHIDINRGWTTELYARFNAIPIRHVSKLTDFPKPQVASNQNTSTTNTTG